MKKTTSNMKKITINKKFKIISLIVLFVAVILIVTILCVNGLREDNTPVSSYKMQLSYDQTSHSLTGREEVTFVNNYDNMFTYLYLHLYPNAFREGAKNPIVSIADEDEVYVDGESYGGIEVLSVTGGGENLEYSIEGEDSNILKVNLPCEVYPDEQITFTIEFVTTLANVNHRLGYGNNTTNFGNFYPVLCVYEEGEGFKTDLYHSNGDPFYSEQANYEVEICYPSSFSLATSGVVLSETNISPADKNTTSVQNNSNSNFTSAQDNSNSENTTSSTDMTMAKVSGDNIRDFCFVLSEIFASKSQQVGLVKVTYYGYTGDNNLNTCLEIAVDALNTYNDLFGEYPYSTLNVVKTNFIHGGMEYPNLVMISDDLSQEDIAYVIAHEIAHQWWYGVVGNDEYNHAWMDEGLTEYSTLLFFERNEKYNVDSKAMIDSATESYKTFVRVYSQVNGSVDTSMDRPLNKFDTQPEYVQCTYTKGLLMFDSIRKSLGDRKFFKALEDYYTDFAFKNATPADMIASFNKSSHCDLEGFFNSWLNGEVVIQ